MKITNDVYLVFSVLKLIVTWVLSKNPWVLFHLPLPAGLQLIVCTRKRDNINTFEKFFIGMIVKIFQNTLGSYILSVQYNDLRSIKRQAFVCFLRSCFGSSFISEGNNSLDLFQCIISTYAQSKLFRIQNMSFRHTFWIFSRNLNNLGVPYFEGAWLIVS